ncbi:MAG: outer membrane beta-barrel family protein [Bacteroidia bacterium]|nr:outer membrane beta-barrel family protein [Bacteroidia bacterium]
MKKAIVSLAASMLLGIVLCAQNSGLRARCTVLDENGAPLEFATVAVLSLPDSTILCGGMTDESGLYETALPEDASLVQVSMIGYGTVEIPSSELSVPKTVQLRPDAKMLEGAVVNASLPRTEIKGDAVVTNITGSVLEHSGNALDVLGKVPGMINKGDGLEVIGRGVPQYYINGRKVTDNSELRNLVSEDIRSIEVVSNPGALYGGDIRSVVRIRTVKRQGDGFSFALTSQAKQHIYSCSDLEPSWSVLDLNYRVRGWDFFGKLVYWNNRSYQISTIDGITSLEKPDGYHQFREKGTLDYRNHMGGFQFQGGANWQINENHSLGFKINRDQGSFGYGRLVMNTGIFLDSVQEDYLSTTNDSRIPTNTQWNGNLYYDGNVGSLNINFNADFVNGRYDSTNEMKESSWVSPAELSSVQKSETYLGAGKLVLSLPVWKGKLQFGAEETYVRAGQTYSITFSDIPDTDAFLTENNIAGFAEYAVALPFGQFSAGLRFEHADYSYVDKLAGGASVQKSFNDWFPSFSFATMAGPVGISLSYTGKTQRPDFNMLSTEMSYNNRYCYQSGDPMLLSEKRRNASLNANWKWLTFVGNYERIDNYFVQWTTPYNDEGVVLIKLANLDVPLRKMSFYLIAAPTAGVWHPSFTLGMEKQFLTLSLEDPNAEGGRRSVSFNKPMYVAQLNNSFRFKNSWQLEANYSYISRMNTSNAEVYRPIQNASLSLQKSFLKDDALTFRLTWEDIFNSSAVYARMDFGRYMIDQPNDRFNSCVILRVSYRFNSASNKYKGTGAGQSAKSRLR